MATSLTQTIPAVTTILGNRVTINAETWSSTGLGTVTIAAASAVSTDLQVEGEIHGFLRFEFADPDTLEGMLTPNELSSAEIQLTQGVASAVLGLISTEIYSN
jgi:hypothetical protein